MPGTRRVAGLEASLKSRLAQLKSDRMPLRDEGGASRREWQRYCSVVRRPLSSRPVATAGAVATPILAFLTLADLPDCRPLTRPGVESLLQLRKDALTG